MKQKLLVILGFLLLGLAFAGLFIPVWPTTPFVLLAAGCFSTSPKLSAWLRKSKLFNDYLTNYKERTGLKKGTVIKSLSFLWITLSISAAVINKTWGYIVMPLIAVIITVHILCMARPKAKVSEALPQDGKTDEFAEFTPQDERNN